MYSAHVNEVRHIQRKFQVMPEALRQALANHPNAVKHGPGILRVGNHTEQQAREITDQQMQRRMAGESKVPKLPARLRDWQPRRFRTPEEIAVIRARERIERMASPDEVKHRND